MLTFRGSKHGFLLLSVFVSNLNFACWLEECELAMVSSKMLVQIFCFSFQWSCMNFSNFIYLWHTKSIDDVIANHVNYVVETKEGYSIWDQFIEHEKTFKSEENNHYAIESPCIHKGFQKTFFKLKNWLHVRKLLSVKIFEKSSTCKQWKGYILNYKILRTIGSLNYVFFRISYVIYTSNEYCFNFLIIHLTFFEEYGVIEAEDLVRKYFDEVHLQHYNISIFLLIANWYYYVHVSYIWPNIIRYDDEIQ